MSRVYINQSEFQDLGPQYNSVAHNIGSINGQIREISHNLEMELGAEEAILNQSEEINLELERTEQNLLDYSEFFNESYEEYEELDDPSQVGLIEEGNVPSTSIIEPGITGDSGMISGTTGVAPTIIIPIIVSISHSFNSPGFSPSNTPGSITPSITKTNIDDHSSHYNDYSKNYFDNRGSNNKNYYYIDYIDKRTFGAVPRSKYGRCAPGWMNGDYDPSHYYDYRNLNGQSRIRRRLPYGYQRPKAHLSSDTTVKSLVNDSKLNTDTNKKGFLDNFDPVSLLIGAGGLGVIVGLPLLINSLTKSNRKNSEPQWAPQVVQTRPPINQRLVPSSNLSQRGWQ